MPALVVLAVDAVGETVAGSSWILEWLAAGTVIVLAPSVEAGQACLASALADNGGQERRRAVIRLGRLEIDLNEQQVRWMGSLLDLTKQELKILKALAEDAGRAWTFAELSRSVWGSAFYGDATAVRSAIKRLRKKLRLAGVEVTIQSVRGVGFRLSSAPREHSLRESGPLRMDAPANAPHSSGRMSRLPEAIDDAALRAGTAGAAMSGSSG